MNKLLFRAAAVAGLLAIAWVAAGYLRTNPLALAMTLLMAGFYGMGVLELQRFQRTTAGLDGALQRLAPAPTDSAALEHWLALVPAPLRTTVRLRVAGERAALPGPSLAPYLAGLLVLLGMLGTFVGMVITLNSTGLALEQASSVQGMRDSLAAPVRGLGLAFGTSVAGVAASAMLGLMSALCRRERQQMGQLLDSHTTTSLIAFSSRSLREQQGRLQRQAAQQLLLEQHTQAQQLHQLQREEDQRLQQQQHQETLHLQRQLNEALKQQEQQQQTRARQALEWQQQQAQHLPQLADRLHLLAAQLDTQAQQSGQALLASQTHFQGQAQQAYQALAASVGQSLQSSLDSSVAATAASLQAAVQATLLGISQETTAVHTQVAATVQQQLLGFAQRFEAQAGSWLQTVGTQAQQQSAALLQALNDAQARQLAQQGAGNKQHTAAWAATGAAMAKQLQDTASHIAHQAEAQARNTIAEVSRLVHTATEAPQVAAQAMADVVAQLRHQLQQSQLHDNTVLQERNQLMATLHTLLAAVQHTSTEQKAAVDQMVATTASWLQQAGARYTERVETESARLETASAQLTSSAVDVASLGDAFGTAVGLFSQSNGQMVEHLQRLETALSKSTARSDDQLAYYVAQAREVIDLSLLSQKQIVDDLQRLASRQTAAAPVATAAAASAAAATALA